MAGLRCRLRFDFSPDAHGQAARFRFARSEVWAWRGGRLNRIIIMARDFFWGRAQRQCLRRSRWARTKAGLAADQAAASAFILDCCERREFFSLPRLTKALHTGSSPIRWPARG